MDLRYLRYFIVVAEQSNFTRAAERLSVAQPSLWLQIRKLEEEVGAELFVRQGRGVVLSDAGQTFLEQARKAVAEADLGVALARRVAKGEISRVAIGYNAPAEFRVFPSIVPAFRRERSDVHLSFHRHGTLQIIDGVRKANLDLGFACLPMPTEDFEVHALTDDPLIAALPIDHRLAAAASISIKDLIDEPMIMFPRIQDPEAYQQIEQLFAGAGGAIQIACELENSLSMINFVAMGVGCSLLPSYARRIQMEGVVWKTIRAPNASKTIAVIARPARSPAVDAFLQCTLKQFGRRRA